jgi:hypothetical protein
MWKFENAFSPIFKNGFEFSSCVSEKNVDCFGAASIIFKFSNLQIFKLIPCNND